MSIDNPINDVIIVGAGIAGLTAAWKLHQYGRQVLVLEKSRGVGGRMANRRVGEATFDHGAQFITARETIFINWLNSLEQKNIVTKWFWGESSKDRHPRWRGVPGMNALAKHLGEHLDIRTEKKVTALIKQGNKWRVCLQSPAANLLARAVILTPPVPQSLQLFDLHGPNNVEEVQLLLTKFTYERCLAVLARLDEPTHLKPPGFLRHPSTNISWLADNQLKGISPTPSLTIHATASFSASHWQKEKVHIGEVLLGEAACHLNVRVRDFQVHGWRYSKPQYIHEQRSLRLCLEPQLILTGDAFGGPRVEGAVLSGWDGAEQLIEAGFKGN